MDKGDLSKKRWFAYLDHSMQDLVMVGLSLLEKAETRDKEEFHDYSYIVFPMAKAYEGFLKKVFLEMGLIEKSSFESKHFRVGKSLNPDLPEKYRDEDWLFDDIQQACERLGFTGLGREMWEVWRKCRNRLFHYWPQHENFIGLAEAKVRVRMIVEVMEKVIKSGLV